jgi:YD repeat-containing protein
LQDYLYRPDGTVLVFDIDGSTGTPRDSDTVGTLTKTGNNVWTFRGTDDVLETYVIRIDLNGDVWGRLSTLEARGGYTLTLDYGGQGLQSVTDSFGRELTFTYSQGRLATMTDPNGNVFQYFYDGSGLLSEVRFPDDTPGDPNDNPAREYSYGSGVLAGAMTTLINENGDVNGAWTYDGSRRATSSERADGSRRLDFTYNGNGTTSVVEDGGETRLYSFDLINNGYRTASVVASGASERTSTAIQ